MFVISMMPSMRGANRGYRWWALCYLWIRMLTSASRRHCGSAAIASGSYMCILGTWVVEVRGERERGWEERKKTPWQRQSAAQRMVMKFTARSANLQMEAYS